MQWLPALTNIEVQFLASSSEPINHQHWLNPPLKQLMKPKNTKENKNEENEQIGKERWKEDGFQSKLFSPYLSLDLALMSNDCQIPW